MFVLYYVCLGIAVCSLTPRVGAPGAFILHAATAYIVVKRWTGGDGVWHEILNMIDPYENMAKSLAEEQDDGEHKKAATDK